MTHKLGIHWLRHHQDQYDLPHVERMQYRSAKLFGESWGNDNFCGEFLAVMPRDAYLLARDHPLSEQKEDMWRDPVNTGYRHANEWADKVRNGRCHLPVDRTFFLGINEPDATNGDRAAIDHYNEAFLRRLQAHGLRGGAFNFSTGHPRTVDGTPHTKADYTVFEASHQAIVEGSHIAVAHIYGTGAVPCAPGHYDRLWACDWQDVEWIIGEFGVDEHVIGGGEHFGFHVPFAGRLHEYCGWLDTAIMGINDPRIHSYQVFTYDFSKPWETFNTQVIRDALQSYSWQHDRPTAPPTPVVVPPVSPSVADTWARSRAFVKKWEGGFQDVDWDIGNWTGCEVGVGEKKGTKFGISACSYPHLDIRNLTIEQADEIYYRDYWLASGANKLPWPYCLLVFDTAVLHGVGTAEKWTAEVGNNAHAFAAKRLYSYTKSKNWQHAGAGWTNRVADLLETASK